ncbi:TetR/AcrR family transcriptional regulator [Nocardia brasiliensis]
MTDSIQQPRNARSERTRSALLAATRALLEEGGDELLTMAAVATRAGVSRRAVYLHFASRAELLTELFGFVNAAENLGASLDAVWQAADAAAALEEWARHVARFHPRVLAIARAIQRIRRIDPDAETHWQLVVADQYACCRRVVTRLSDEGRLASPWTVESGADMLWALMSFEMLEELLVDRGWSAQRYRVHLAALLESTFLGAAPAEVRSS